MCYFDPWHPTYYYDRPSEVHAGTPTPIAAPARRSNTEPLEWTGTESSTHKAQHLFSFSGAPQPLNSTGGLTPHLLLLLAPTGPYAEREKGSVWISPLTLLSAPNLPSALTSDKCRITRKALRDTRGWHVPSLCICARAVKP